MATYKVKHAQNIFDVALHLYGTIEGLFDLLITNYQLNMTADLKSGMELEYHDDFVVSQEIKDQLAEWGITPSNSERHVYYKRPDADLRMIIPVFEMIPNVSFKVTGEGVMIIDWGDNSDLEYVTLSETQEASVEHWFDNTVEQRRIRIYGDFTLIHWDTTGLKGALRLTRPLAVDEYESHGNGYDLTGLFLFDGTYAIDLSVSSIASLMPIADMSLAELNLEHVAFTSEAVLEEYLQYVAAPETHGTRRGCTVRVTEEPTPAGYAAMDAILAEPEWNTPFPWQFYINGQLYVK